METTPQHLTTKQQYLVKIAVLTAKNEQPRLEPIFNEALDAGLTINEINEELAHLYAYCGFASPVRSVNTFRRVVEERAARGVTDDNGRTASPITATETTYKRGETVQSAVTGLSAEQLQIAFSFNPVMDRFLKEHLFADIFGSDVLSYSERELTTVSALAAMQDEATRPHFGGALNVGVTEAQLQELLAILDKLIGSQEAVSARQILTEVVAARKKGVPLKL